MIVVLVVLVLVLAVLVVVVLVVLLVVAAHCRSLSSLCSLVRCSQHSSATPSVRLSTTVTSGNEPINTKPLLNGVEPHSGCCYTKS